MGLPVGVVAIQGDFEKHILAFQSLGIDEVPEIRTPEELATVESLVIPGGESTTVGKLMDRFGLGAEIQRRASAGMPVWGTCMGMILMASDIEGSDQYRLSLLDITVKRNAFGAQVHSFEDDVTVATIGHPVTGVFIRAPIVTRLGDGVQELARYDEKVVAVQSGNLIGTSFHPELTQDTGFHQWFLALAK